MNKLAEAFAIDANKTFTEKGMSALKSSNDACVDLFFKIGAMRGQDVIPAFSRAYNENREYATRIALWARDVRGGAGERKLFRDILGFLEYNNPNLAAELVHMIPELGRWDDLLVFTRPFLKHTAYEMIGHGIFTQNGLCAKWMPRQGTVAKELADFFKVSPKFWRKTLVRLTNVVEQKMCAKQWDLIEFGKLPSMAAKRYSKAFQRNVGEKYNTYLAALKSGEAKVNAGAIYPHQIVEKIQNHQDVILADAMWAALPNYLGDESIIPIVDTSGSMFSANVAHIAIALGMYLAEKGKGPFKDCFINFSEASEIQRVTGSITDRYQQMSTAAWGGTTNIAAAFNQLLDVAVRNHVSASDMPKIVLILSDMQFDACVDMGQYGERSYWYGAPKQANPKALEMVKFKYEKAGYPVPRIVFWNIADRGNNIPVTFKQDGTALVSGFSPSIMKSILAAKMFTPEGIMLETIMQDRYNYMVR